MNTSTAVISPQTAPRSIEELSKIGIFQLRLLIDKLGGLQTPEQKQAFAGLKAEEKVNLAAQLLAAWDKQNGGAPQAPPAPHMNGTNGAGAGFAPAMSAAPPAMAQMSAPALMTQQPLPMGAPQMGQTPAFGGFPSQPLAPPAGMPQMSPPVQQVDPAAVAAAQTAATPTATERKPRTKKTEGAETDIGPQIMTALTQLGGLLQQNGEQINAIGAAVNAMTEETKKNAGIRDDIKQLATSYSGVYNVLASWDARITTLQTSTNLAIALCLFLGEQALGASKQDLIQAAMGDIPAIAALLATPGKG